MEVVVNAKYGSVLRSAVVAYYVPTRTPSWTVRTPATVETLPELERTNVWTPTADPGKRVAVTPADLLHVDGVIPFSGDTERAVSRASDWAQLEELVGPLRYRDDVEDAGMYVVEGTYRPRIPLRVARCGVGAIAQYLLVHGHDVLMVKQALAVTFHRLMERIHQDVCIETPSFECPEREPVDEPSHEDGPVD